MSSSSIGGGGGGALTTGIQELTRRLQDERDALQRELDEAARALHGERNARTTLENALQVKELELLHLTQKHHQTSQQLRNRVLAVERELEDEKRAHQVTLMSKNVAVQKNEALAADVKQVEVKWRKEMEKKELALAEVEILREDMRVVAIDRDQLVQRTEADAKRVRELWQQIVREHDTQLDALRQELEASKQSNVSMEAMMVQRESRIQGMEETIKNLMGEKAALEQRVASATSDHTSFQERLELEQFRDKEREEKVHALNLQVQELRSECVVAKQHEEMAVREQKLAKAVLKQCQSQLDAKSEELLVLKTEFSELLDKHEQMDETLKIEARQQLAQVQLQSKQLAHGKRCAEELAELHKREILGYRKVLASVNQKLHDVADTHAAAKMNSWTLLPQGSNNGATASKQTSLCIYRH
uniref:Uncharacterized protein n=1 Tax=Globisporangium ultimum (strain ATCC 200006 / CBS 805.95 / DAOM BR144) TaxID=431595 RepID=K3WQD5_GLOUD